MYTSANSSTFCKGQQYDNALLLSLHYLYMAHYQKIQSTQRIYSALPETIRQNLQRMVTVPISEKFGTLQVNDIIPDKFLQTNFNQVDWLTVCHCVTATTNIRYQTNYTMLARSLYAWLVSNAKHQATTKVCITAKTSCIFFTTTTTISI